MDALTAAQLNRATLGRQLLLRREPIGVVDAVSRLGALQAQSPPSPYLALWNRLAGFDPADLDAALDEHALVKASLLRLTLHVAAADDYPVFHRAMLSSLRASCLHDERFKQTGLTIAEADALVSQVVAFAAQARTNAELEAKVDEWIGVRPKPGVWWALRRFSPLIHADTGAPWTFGVRPSFVASPIEPFTRTAEEAHAVLLRRYLLAFGPATDADFGQFTILRQPAIRPALQALADELVTYKGPGGKTLYDVRGGALPAGDTPAPPRLLGMWDNVLLAYKDRSRVIPEPYRKLVIRSNGDTLPTVLVDGHVAGVWRAVDAGIEVTAFRDLTPADWDGLAAEASALQKFVAPREPLVYKRYWRAWETFPPSEVRLLP